MSEPAAACLRSEATNGDPNVICSLPESCNGVSLPCGRDGVASLLSEPCIPASFNCATNGVACMLPADSEGDLLDASASGVAKEALASTGVPTDGLL
mmetsp:Transcript_51064/g.144602  ORF Transcript_51064/g.144602 Transcript_51064/m.144602 type:complete len:97 (+) Transcript_51064:412-702(+)